MKRLFLLLALLTVMSAVGFAYTASVKFVKFDYDVMHDGRPSLCAHYKVKVTGLKGKKVKLTMYIESPKGTPVKDLNNSYRTTSGGVSASNTGTATYDNSVWSDFPVYIPHSEIHAMPGKRTYYVQALLWDENQKELARSDYSTFTMTGSSKETGASRSTGSGTSRNNGGKTFSRKYYMSMGRASNGTLWVGEGNNNLSLTLNISPEKITVSGSRTPYINKLVFSYQKTEKNGDRVYCAPLPKILGANAREYIRISSDYKNIGWSSINSDGSWLLTQYWTSDVAERNRVVAENRKYQKLNVPIVATDKSNYESSDWRDGLRYPEYQDGARKSGGGRKRQTQQSRCTLCGGTGVNPNYYDEGKSHSSSRHEWLIYINERGTKCPYCSRYTRHFHDRCSRCNTPTHY